MIAAWLAKLWAKTGTWLALAGAVIVAVWVAFMTGKHKGEDAGLADAAQQAIKDARAAQQVTADAAQAADKVQADAAKQPPPDVEHRDDLDNTGFPQ